MATYREIQDRVRALVGYTPKTCWIADVKSQHGLTSRTASNRLTNDRVHPCPADKKTDIEAALRQFGMIK
ncbi:MAG: hypothetical protein B7X57_08445 [Erythrobacter sp. 34-65-8]|nr:MAG: hypothetical protein B7X57_08445 [Erythrobacter sp. 34-65-8]